MTIVLSSPRAAVSSSATPSSSANARLPFWARATFRRRHGAVKRVASMITIGCCTNASMITIALRITRTMPSDAPSNSSLPPCSAAAAWSCSTRPIWSVKRTCIDSICASRSSTVSTYGCRFATSIDHKMQIASAKITCAAVPAPKSTSAPVKSILRIVAANSNHQFKLEYCK